MMGLDTRIPMQVPNVLGMRQQVAQTNALNANSLAQGFNAVQRGMEAPMRRNMLAEQVQGAGIQNTQQEQAMLGQVLDKVAAAPETWGAARQFLVGNGIFEEGELPEQLTEQTFRELSAVAFTPAEELTDYQRKLAGLNSPDPRVREASEIALNMRPGAQAPESYTLSPGQVRVGPGGNVEASVPANPKGVRGADGFLYNEYTGERMLPNEQAPGLKPPSGYQLSPDGQSFTFIPGGPADPAVIAQNAQARGPSTVISMGNGVALPKPPTGYMWRMDQNTGQPVIGADGGGELIPIRGGPAEAEAEAIAGKEEGRRETAMRAASVVTDSIVRSVDIINNSDFPTTGFWGEGLSRIPGTAAHDLDQMLNTVKSNAAFDRLQQMRDNSATGGALGGVSTIELQLLSSSISALEQSQGKDQLLENLARVHNTYLDIIFGAGEGPARMPVAFQSGDIKRRYDFLKAQYPDDPNKVLKIMKAEGLIDRAKQ